MKKFVLVFMFLALFFSFVGGAMAQEFPELQWTTSYNVEAGQTVQGPAIIEKEDEWVKVNVGESYTLSKGGHANFYEGNQAGLDKEYLRTIEGTQDVVEEDPHLVWTTSYNVEIGETVQGPAIIEKEDEWVKVNVGESYTLSKGGHANFYEGNQAGLDAEYLRTLRGLLGDVNGDGLVNVQDVTLITQYVLGLIDFSQEQEKAADVTQSGNINVQDVTLVMQYALGITNTFE